MTRSISPEISSVAGLRSGMAAFIGDSFSHGRSAVRITEIVLAGRGVAAFLFRQADQHHFRHRAHGIALIA